MERLALLLLAEVGRREEKAGLDINLTTLTSSPLAPPPCASPMRHETEPAEVSKKESKPAETLASHFTGAPFHPTQPPSTPLTLIRKCGALHISLRILLRRGLFCNFKKVKCQCNPMAPEPPRCVNCRSRCVNNRISEANLWKLQHFLHVASLPL